MQEEERADAEENREDAEEALPQKYYAGIGSRATPKEILDMMTKIAEGLSRNYILRSGGADGADSAFEKGAGDKKISYIPWPGFNGSKAEYIAVTSDAMRMAGTFHPAWMYLSYPAKKLHARNCYQILGEDLNTPCHFVVCWTPGGEEVGGTAQAIRIAKANGIKIFNLAKEEDFNFWNDKLCQH
jgi:hypothetical protein